MATLSTGTIGAGAVFAPDYIFNAFALPNATNYSSSAFEFGNNQAGTRILLTNDDEITMVDAKVLTIELFHSDTFAGSYTAAKTLYTVTASTTVIAAGTEIVNETSQEDYKHWCKIKITTDDDLDAFDITANVHYISH